MLDPVFYSLAEAFDLGHPETVEKLQTGLIQQTWKLSTRQGIDEKIYICQKLHPVFDAGVTEDGEVISNYLRSEGFPTPEYLRTIQGFLHWQSPNELDAVDLNTDLNLWRVMNCLPGTAHAIAPDLSYLQQAGYVAGQMHQALAKFNHQFKFQIPYFHDTPHIWQELETHWIQSFDPDIATEATFLLETVPQLFLPVELAHQIIHGDLKLVNFLFNEQGSIVGLLDFDTFMNHSLYIELGDALRSWASEGHTFKLAAAKASLAGYAQSGALKQLDPEYLVMGLKLITLELGMRFLKDYFEDCYWAWDPSCYPNRKAHNLARCRKQIALYQNIFQQEKELLNAISAEFI